MSEKFQRIPVQLTIHTTSEDQPDIEQTERYKAQLYDNGVRKILVYEEPVIDEGVIKCSIILTANEVKIIRHGVIEMNQVYKTGQTIAGAYRTPYGTFHLETETHACEMDLKEREGTITLRYDVKLNGQHVGQRLLLMRYHV